VQATSSLDYGSSQKLARETTHKRMREQTEKFSSEIRKNVTSTFKLTTDFTDVFSSKHVLANTTADLINYELRRKMRQVSVQVQDNGTFLCWQTYVDDPGRSLGLGTLIHIARPPELDGLAHPEEIPLLQPFEQELWDVASGSLQHTLHHDSEVRAVTFSPNGQLLAGSGDKTVQLWDVASGSLQHTLHHEDWVEAVEFSPDGRLLAAGAGGSRAVLYTVQPRQGRLPVVPSSP